MLNDVFNNKILKEKAFINFLDLNKLLYELP